MKRILLSLSLLIMAVVYGSARERTLSEMQSIAARQLRTTTRMKAKRGNVQPQSIRCIVENEAYAVFEPQSSDAFVIVSKSDLTEAVIGYADQAFNLADMPADLKWFLSGAEQTILNAEATGISLSRRTKSYTAVENFITTTWHQEYPYNQKTPNKYYTGCVATALAQCMNYCQWPASASFEGGYYIQTGSGSSAKYKDYKATVNSTYTWPYKDKYKKLGSYGDNIDELMRDCGYATYMIYASDGSGTNTQYCGFALTSCFNYPEECVKTLSKEHTDEETFNETIYAELQRRSPVLMGAQSEEGGHAFVLCGMDEEGLVYVNWGWGASGDGYYDLSLMNPDGEDPEYVQKVRIVYGIRSTPLPEDHVVTRINTNSEDPYTFSWRTEEDEKGVPHPTLYIQIPYGFENMNASSFKGNMGIFGEDLTDGTTWVIAPELQDPEEIPAGAGWYDDSEEFYFYYFVDGEQGLKPGHTYRLSFGACDEREGVWHSLLCVGGERAYDVTYTGDVTTCTVNPTPQPVPLVDAISAPKAGKVLADGFTRVYDLQGRLLYTAPAATFNLWDVPARGILVIKEGDKARKVAR